MNTAIVIVVISLSEYAVVVTNARSCGSKVGVVVVIDILKYRGGWLLAAD